MGASGSHDIAIFEDGELEQELKRLGGKGDITLRKLLDRSFDHAVQFITRPKRAVYEPSRLGAHEFTLSTNANGVVEANGHQKVRVRRNDFTLDNDRVLKLACSHWKLYDVEASASTSRDGDEGQQQQQQQQQQDLQPRRTPCLIYMHSNIGSRLDSLRVRDVALGAGLSVFSFDYSGSGLSDGLYVTMGWNESKDFHFVLKHLEQDPSVSEICLYAHSMSCFPAIVNVASRSLVMDPQVQAKMDSLPALIRPDEVDHFDKPIRGMVIDGGYTNMKRFTEELLMSIQKEGLRVPMSILRYVRKLVTRTINKRIEVDLTLLKPVDFVPACFVPALFVSGDNDQYVKKEHSDELCSQYGGAAIAMQVEGDHYSARKPEVYEEAVRFLVKALASNADRTANGNSHGHGCAKSS